MSSRNVLAALVLVAGCGDDADGMGQGGTGSATSSAESGPGSQGEASATEGGDACAPVVLSVDEDCFGIGSAQSFLDEGTSEHVETLEWVASMTPDLSHTPAMGTTMVTVQLVYEGGEVRCRPSCDLCPPGEKCPGPVIQPSLEVDVVVEVSTEDGAFADSWPTVLHGGPDAATNFQLLAALSELQGSLVVESPTGMWTELALDVRSSYADGAMTGFASVQASDGVTMTALPLARWPPP